MTFFIYRFKLWYTVDRPNEGWKYSSGFINAEMIEKALFPPSSDNLVQYTLLSVVFIYIFSYRFCCVVHPP